MGEWELILFSSFSAAASSFRLPACVMLCVVLLFFVYLMLSFIDPFLVLCVFVCYICVSFALSVSSFRSRAPRSRSDGGSDATKGSRARGSIIAACLHVLSLSLTLILSFVAKRTPHSMSLSACCVVKRQLNKCMCVCACVLNTPLCICAHNFTVILKQLIKLTCYYFSPCILFMLFATFHLT